MPLQVPPATAHTDPGSAGVALCLPKRHGVPLISTSQQSPARLSLALPPRQAVPHRPAKPDASLLQRIPPSSTCGVRRIEGPQVVPHHPALLVALHPVAVDDVRLRLGARLLVLPPELAIGELGQVELLKEERDRAVPPGVSMRSDGCEGVMG